MKIRVEKLFENSSGYLGCLLRCWLFIIQPHLSYYSVNFCYLLYWNENIPMATSILPECAVAILLRKVSVAAVSSFAFNAAKLSTNLSFYPTFFPQQNEMIPDTKYVCMQVFFGGVHQLRCQVFGFFWPPTPPALTFSNL